MLHLDASGLLGAVLLDPIEGEERGPYRAGDLGLWRDGAQRYFSKGRPAFFQSFKWPSRSAVLA